MLPRSPLTRALPLALSFALAAGCAGCGGDDEPHPTPTTTEPSTSTTTDPELSDEQQIEALLTEWFEALPLIFTGDRPVRSAADYIAGDYLEGFTDAVERIRSNGIAVVPSDDSAQVIESIDLEGDTAVAVICTKDASSDTDAETGEVLDDEIAVIRYQDRIERSPDDWLIVGRAELERLPTATECPGSDR